MLKVSDFLSKKRPNREVIKWSLCSSVCLQVLTPEVCLGPWIKKEWHGSTPPLDREGDRDCQWIPRGRTLKQKKKKKSRDLAKVIVLLETSIDLESKNNENQ